METICIAPSSLSLLYQKSSKNDSVLPSKRTKQKHFRVSSTFADRIINASPVKPLPTTPAIPMINVSPEKPLPTTPAKPMIEPVHSSPIALPSESLRYESGFLGAVPNRVVQRDRRDGADGNIDYLTKILNSRCYEIIDESPLQYAPNLSERFGNHLWFKREDLHPVFSFKLRGAYNMMSQLPIEQLKKGLICSSGGNHVQGVALAAKKLGCEVLVVIPTTALEIKKTVESMGAKTVLVGETFDEAQTYAKQRAKDEGRTFVPAFDHPDIIAGQGTVGMEILRQIKSPLHAIFVPVGGGGLIAGIASYVKSVKPEVKVIGVEPFDANGMALSLHHGQRIVLDKVGGFADSVAIRAIGKEPFRICRELVDGVVLVSRDAICASIKDMFEEKRSILEPSGALALAGAEAYCKYYGLKNENIVAITSGANMNFDRLWVVTQLATVGRQQEAILATYLPEKKGSLKQFCKLVGPHNITKFRYRYNARKQEAVVLYSVELHKISEVEEMLHRMKSSSFETTHLTDNVLVKDHLQHLMGGQSSVENEIICHFSFPERQGVLMEFLDAFCPRWNISLFHYRGQGEAGANVLVGLQVGSSSEMDDFKKSADSLGYHYVIETNNEILKLLLHKSSSLP
ncbi:Pyridoxal-phosphate dependent enzyme [Dillenia turbinata]|uniref:Threonine dehydratase n=1 Tax=Dillenia turbinata TaxID=194707 RepID=A0AAN8VL18_9MAGN